MAQTIRDHIMQFKKQKHILQKKAEEVKTCTNRAEVSNQKESNQLKKVHARIKNSEQKETGAA